MVYYLNTLFIRRSEEETKGIFRVSERTERINYSAGK